MGAQIGVWVFLYAMFRKQPIYHTKKGTLIEMPQFKDVLDAVDGVFCQPFFMLLAAIALKATYDLSESISTRWSSTTNASYWFREWPCLCEPWCHCHRTPPHA